MRKVNEIFHSLQGEGYHTGRASVFVRFSGCNLRCPFCDTDHEPGRLMSDEEIFAEVAKYPAHWVILTGGEPSLQIDSEFVAALKRATGKLVAIETNGTHPLPPEIDWVTVSPKAGGNVVIDRADEIKVVETGQPLEPYFSLKCRAESTHMFLQPCWVQDPKERASNAHRTVERVLADPRWRLSTQTHRFLGIE